MESILEYTLISINEKTFWKHHLYYFDIEIFFPLKNIENWKYRILFGNIFIYENKNNDCCIIYEGEEYKLSEKIKIKNDLNNIINKKLKGIDNITSMSCMFDWGSTL